MPIYLYKCDNCKQTTEKLQRVNEPPLVTCNVCGEDALRKIIAPVGIQFKGSGFHINDYSGNGRKNGKSTSGDNKSSSGAEAKGDSGATDKSTSSSSSTGKEGSKVA